MKIYFAAMAPFAKVYPVEKLGIKNVLSSWLEGREDMFHKFNMFIDSGAFTTWKQGKPINIQDYIRFIKAHEKNLPIYANLDVIGDPDGTWKNQQIMEQAGLHPLPTYHLREDIKWLHHYLERYDYIALGGTVGSHRNIIEPFLDTCFSVIKNYWPKKVHGFGISSLWALKKYPFYSVDSTSWMVGGRFGNVLGKVNISKKSFGVVSKDREYYSKTWDYKDRHIRNIREYLKLEQSIGYYWSKRGIKWD